MHCDFKPGNILVGDDGRVRVVDFGIAQRTPLSRTLASTNAEGVKKEQRMVVGTPRYLSPEQATGRPLDAPSDQFSFCVTLYEALYREHPFAGRDHRERLRQARASAVRAAPRGSTVPSRVNAAIVRGLQSMPADRWPTMDALLDALGRAQRDRRRTGVLMLGGGAALGLVALGLSSTPDPCASTRGELDDAWSPQRRDRILDAFLASSLPTATDQANAIDDALDDFASAWLRARHDACSATERSAPSEVPS